MSRVGLVGHTGFVGGALRRRRSFAGFYNSSNIGELAGERFDRVVCAGAPAVMWAANADPEGDAANLDRLIAALRSAEIGTLVLISTVAVFDDPSAGYAEDDARYETAKAYGRNRRRLEVQAAEAFDDVRIVRLPALFGPGLKKNFIFDLMNPAPSFINPTAYEKTAAAFSAAERAMLAEAYAFDAGLKMWRLRREELSRAPLLADLTEALERIGFVARNFTNSESRYQFYNIERLADDIDRIVDSEVRVVNLCSEPLSAREVHLHLTGEDFANDGPARVSENVRTRHAGLFGGAGDYTFDRATVLSDLKAYFAEAGFAKVRCDGAEAS